MNPDFDEAKEILAEMLEELEDASDWCKAQLSDAIFQVTDHWNRICIEENPIHSSTFQSHCRNLLEDCEIIQTSILERSRKFVDLVENRLPILKSCSDNNSWIAALTMEILNRWNTTEQPQFMNLFEKVEELELRIRGFMNSY